VGVDHVYAVLLAPVTVALNGADWPLVIEIQVGATEMLTFGIRVMVAARAGCPVLSAFTVTVVMDVMVAGAV